MRLPLVILFAAVFGAGLLHAGMVATSNDARSQQAQQLAAAGELDAALAIYLELAEREPGSADLQARIGGMQLLKQNYQAAITSFQTAIGLDAHSHGEAFIGLGIAYLHLGKYGPARAALTQAQELKPESADDLNHLVSWLDARTSDPAEPVHP